MLVAKEGQNDKSILDRYYEIKSQYQDQFVVTYKETLSTEDAQYLLNNMHRNRNIKAKNITIVKSKLMEEGWIEPSAISISTDGLLLDGQHRLSALIDTGLNTTNAIIYWNVLPKRMHDLDTGSSRTEKDIFKILGYSYSSVIKSIVDGLLLGNKLKYTAKNRKNGLLDQKDFPSPNGNNVAIPTKKYEEFYNLHQDSIDSVLKSFYGEKSTGFSFPIVTLSGLVRAIHGGYCSIDDIQEFLHTYFNPEEGFLKNKNQPFILQKVLTKNIEKQGSNAKLLKYQQVEKAFSYFLEERPLPENGLNSSAIQSSELFPCPDFDFKE